MDRAMLERRRPQTTEEALIQIFDVLVEMEKDLIGLSGRLEKQECKSSRLERWQAWVGGASAAVGLLTGYLLKSLPDILKNIRI